MSKTVVMTLEVRESGGKKNLRITYCVSTVVVVSIYKKRSPNSYPLDLLICPLSLAPLRFICFIFTNLYEPLRLLLRPCQLTLLIWQGSRAGQCCNRRA